MFRDYIQHCHIAFCSCCCKHKCSGFNLKGFRALGADVEIEYGKILAEADRLVGKHIYFDVVSVGATINVMMAATMAEGLTIMENVAKEPHVVDIANFLNSMGANIREVSEHHGS